MTSVQALPLTSGLKTAAPTCPVRSNGTAHSAVDQVAHAYKCPVTGDIRGVCPALNALANHSYLPHDGKNITFSILAQALHAGYGISPGFANFLVLGSYLLLKRGPWTPLDLEEIAKYNAIEHNASIVHDDADGAPLAPGQVDPDLLQKFLTKAYSPPDLNATEGPDTFTVKDIAHTRVAREAVSGPINALHAQIAQGEFAMVLDIFGKGSEKTLSKEQLDMWLNENRFPDGWTPSHAETLHDTAAENKKMGELVKAYRGAEKAKVHHGLLSSIHQTVEGLLHNVERVALRRTGVSTAEVVSDEKQTVDVTKSFEALKVQA